MSIKIIIDNTNATEDDIKTLNEIFSFAQNMYYFDKANIDVIELTTEDKKIAASNNTSIEENLSYSVIVGTQKRQN